MFPSGGGHDRALLNDICCTAIHLDGLQFNTVGLFHCFIAPCLPIGYPVHDIAPCRTGGMLTGSTRLNLSIP